MIEQSYDVIIAGGGMVGASLACDLASKSAGRLSILVVENFPLPDNAAQPMYQPSFDARSTALSAGSKNLLEAMGVWATLKEYVQPIDKIHVSNKGRLGSTLMDAKAEQLDGLGFVVENHWLGKVLLSELLGHESVSWLSPAKVVSVSNQHGSPEVSVEYDQAEITVACQLLVVADGAQSALAQSLGI